jgi:hypothetical protein
LLSALHDQWGSAQFKSNEVIAVYEKVAGCAARQGLPATEQALHAAIDEVLGGGNRVNVRTFGNWARRVKGAHYGDLVLHARSGGHTKTSEYVIRRK